MKLACYIKEGLLIHGIKSVFRLAIRKKFFTVGLVRHWNRLPRALAESLSLEVFANCVDEALGDMS